MRSKLSLTPSWMLRCAALIVALTLGGGSFTIASAQSPAVPSVVAGQPFKVTFDHDCLNVTHYRLLLNGAQVVEVPASACVGGSVTVAMSPLTPGSYSLIAVARNAPATPFVNPKEAASPEYRFEARIDAPTPNPPAWRVTSVFTADGRGWIETIVALAEVPTLRLMADGTARVER